MNRISFFLSVRLQEEGSGLSTWRQASEEGFPLRIALLLESFLRMFRQEDIADFFLVCPEKDIEAITKLLRTITRNQRYRIIPELEICPEISEMKNPMTGKIEGWHVQQLIKLAVFERISTAFYITLDSDIFCTRPFSAEELFVNGKALLNIERPGDYRRLYSDAFAKEELNQKKARYINSGKILGYKRPVRLKHRFYGETPVIMHTESVSRLARHISDKFTRPWRSVLAEKLVWTEYTLYFQYLEMNGTLSRIYRKSGCNSVLHLEKSIWHANSRYRKKREYDRNHFKENMHREAKGFFIAVQSWLDTQSWLPERLKTIDAFYAEVREWLFSDQHNESESQQLFTTRNFLSRFCPTQLKR